MKQAFWEFDFSFGEFDFSWLVFKVLFIMQPIFRDFSGTESWHLLIE